LTATQPPPLILMSSREKVAVFWDYGEFNIKIPFVSIAEKACRKLSTSVQLVWL